MKTNEQYRQLEKDLEGMVNTLTAATQLISEQGAEVKAAYIAGYNEGYEGGNVDGRYQSNGDMHEGMAAECFDEYILTQATEAKT